MKALHRRVGRLEQRSAGREPDTLILWEGQDVEKAIAERYGPAGAPPGLVVHICRWAADRQ